MSDCDASFFRKWREAYRWPRSETRRESELRILCLEQLVKENILAQGPFTLKQVLICLVGWKTRDEKVYEYEQFSEEQVVTSIRDIQTILGANPQNVYEAISLLGKPPHDGYIRASISVASTLLRFFDPIKHRYGIIDTKVSKLFQSNRPLLFTVHSIGLLSALSSQDA